MKAKWFYYFLNEAYKLEAEREQTLATIGILPYMNKEGQTAFFRELSQSRSDIMDVGQVNEDYSGLESLKRNLGVKK